MGTHDTPWPQLVLYQYNFYKGNRQFYEQEELEPDVFMQRFASIPDRMNVLVKLDTDGIIPDP